jgi:hypothetical protein
MNLILFILLIISVPVYSTCPKDMKEWQDLQKGLEEYKYSNKASEPEKKLLDKITLNDLVNADPKSYYSKFNTDGELSSINKDVATGEIKKYLKKCLKQTPEQFLQNNLLQLSTGLNEGCIRKLNNKLFSPAMMLNDKLNKLLPKFMKELADSEIDRCLLEMNDPGLEICLSDWRIKRLKNKIRSSETDDAQEIPVSINDYMANNSEAIGIESIPTEINNQETLKGLSNPRTVEATISKLKESLKSKDAIIYKNNTIHEGLPLDNLTERLIVNINDGNCNRTYVISLPDKISKSNKQFASFAICNKDPKTGKPLDKPIQFIGDYWREYENDQVNVNYRTGGENCFRCHTKGPIHINSDQSKSSAKDLEEEKKLNERYSSFKKADFVTFDPALNKYVETFSKDYRKMLGNPIGPIKPEDDPIRELVLEKCLPQTSSGYLSSEKFIDPSKGQKRLKQLISKSMNCSSCHNPHEEGGLYQINDRNPIQLRDYFLNDNMPHEMPPGLTDEGIKAEDKAKIRKILYACLLFEKNQNFSDTDFVKEYLDPKKVDARIWQEDDPKRESCPDGAKFKPQKKNSLTEMFQADPNCLPKDGEVMSLANIGTEISNKLVAVKKTLIEDNVVTGEDVKNNELFCKDGELYFPVFATPGCTGSCNPFSTTLKFDQDGNFLNFSDEFCSNCKEYPLQKYGHVNANSTELENLKSFLKKTSSNKEDNSAYIPKKYFVDGLSGATQVNYPVKGMGESTYILNKYAKDVSDQIRDLKGKLCP